MKQAERTYFTSFKLAGINFKLFSTKKGISKLNINRKEPANKNLSLTKLQPDDPYFFGALTQLEEYFQNKRKKFDLPLDLHGTYFQLRVWNELMQIPFGEVVTYAVLAKKLANRNYVRAVGKACASNPVPIIVPCHRVLNTNGKLGGYTGGLEVKIKLLELEGSMSLELFDQN